MSLVNVIHVMIIGIFIWFLIEIFFEKIIRKPSWWKIINILIFCIMIFIIIELTILSRGNSTEVVLAPFHFLEEAKQQPEIYRSMLMNVFLFFPLGLTLPFCLPERWRGKGLFTILFALLLSAGIEYVQYYFHLGRAETDDVICNTLGAAIGTVAYVIRRGKLKKLILGNYER